MVVSVSAPPAKPLALGINSSPVRLSLLGLVFGLEIGKRLGAVAVGVAAMMVVSVSAPPAKPLALGINSSPVRLSLLGLVFGLEIGKWLGTVAVGVAAMMVSVS